MASGWVEFEGPVVSLKETAGGALGDERMQAEGRGEQMTGKAQETAAKAAERLKKSGQ
ncbi:CsbD family protein [Streptomyces sp. NPDC057557]|uniref:CsbD family protein n=1 Tax=Streptomyces sp. NPDC057557 TaxID=3346167 RepID=UPI0036C616C0